MNLYYLLLCLFNLPLCLNGYEGFYYREATGVGPFTLESLSRDIVEKIKQATGHPISSDIFVNVLSEPSRRYKLLLPYKKVKKGKGKSRKGMSYKEMGGIKSSRGMGKHYSEAGRSGKKGTEKWGGNYGESSGSKNDFMKESEFTDEHYHKEEGEKSDDYKKGHKHGRGYIKKGFEDVYHRDETKKSDSFWNNEEKEGKWIKFGSKKRKHEDKEEKKTVKKEKKSGKDSKEYKSAKGHESERKNVKSSKMEHGSTTKGEVTKKAEEITERKS